MKVVLDSNVWISGLLWNGVPGEIIQLVRNQQLRAYAANVLLTELLNSLSRPKLQSRLNYWGYTAEYLIRVVQALVETCPIAPLEVADLRDPDDAIVLAIAQSANVDAIVTGDRDLLILKEVAGIPISTPTNFLHRYFPVPKSPA